MHSFKRIFKISIYTLSALSTFALGFMIQGRDGSAAQTRLDVHKNSLGTTVQFGTPVAHADIIEGDDSSCGTCASCSMGDGATDSGADGCDSDSDGDCGE